MLSAGSRGFSFFGVVTFISIGWNSRDMALHTRQRSHVAVMRTCWCQIEQCIYICKAIPAHSLSSDVRSDRSLEMLHVEMVSSMVCLLPYLLENVVGHEATCYKHAAASIRARWHSSIPRTFSICRHAFDRTVISV